MKVNAKEKARMSSLQEIAKMFVHLRKTRKALEAREEKLRERLLSLVPEIPCVIPVSDDKGLKIQHVSVESLDGKKLRLELPEIAAKYTITRSRIDIRETSIP